MIVLGCALLPDVARAQHLGIGSLFHRDESAPPAPPRYTMSQLAGMIDGIEEKIIDDGTVVIKQPDVWGQARMTKYRRDFEEQMAKDLSTFTTVFSARLSRSDQASLESLNSLGAALNGPQQGASGRGGRRPAGGSANSSTAVSTPTTINVPDAQSMLAQQAPDGTITRTKPFDLLNNRFQTVSKDSYLGVEPTIYLDEKKHYLDHLNELRRVNLGDDVSDSAGYGLFLVRMPVSIQPGEMSHQGKGAVLTVSAFHDFRPDFVATTFRNLVINEAVDQLTPIIYELIRRGGWEEDLEKVETAIRRQGAALRYRDELERQMEREPTAPPLPAGAPAPPTEAAPVQSNPAPAPNRPPAPVQGAPIPTGDLRARRAPPQPVPSGSGRGPQVAQVTKPPRDTSKQAPRDPAITRSNFQGPYYAPPAPTFAPSSDYGPREPEAAPRAPGYVSQPSDYPPYNLDVERRTARRDDAVREFNRRTIDQYNRGRDSFDPYDDFRPPPPAPYYLEQTNAPLPAAFVERAFSTDIIVASRELEKPGTASRQAVEHAHLRAQLLDQRFSLLAPNDYDSVFLMVNLCRIAKEAKDSLRNTKVRATDIHAFLRNELEAAYDGIMARRDSDKLGPLFDREMMESITDQIRDRRFELPKGAQPDSKEEQNALEDWYDYLMRTLPGNLKQRKLGALCWVIAVDAGLLNRRLRDELRRYDGVSRFACPPNIEDYTFYLPYPPTPGSDPRYQENEDVMRRYVQARWPIIAFALDPVVDQQNVLDAYSLRRDMQLAVAFKFSTGQANFSQFTRYMRRIEQDAEVVALNRTVTTFVHGDHTFGWRFYPRHQNPPTASNLKAIGELFRGGPGPDNEIKQSKLEAGQRELTAVIVMPSFLPEIRMEANGNWFRLHDPDQMLIPTKRMLEQGRKVEDVKHIMTHVCNAGDYRPEDLTRLSARLEQVEAMLPLQTVRVRMPFENDLSGSNLFIQGAPALVPILTGYEGADTIDPDAEFTDLLIYGKHISIHETKVVIGGQFCDPATVISMTAPTATAPAPGSPAGTTTTTVTTTPAGSSTATAVAVATNTAPPGAFEVVSREVVRVRVVNKFAKVTLVKGRADGSNEDNPEAYVEIHLATPNGISNRVLIPYGKATESGGPSYALDPKSKLEISYEWFTRNPPPPVSAPRAVLGASVDPNQGGNAVSFTWDASMGVAPKALAVKLHADVTRGSQKLPIEVVVQADGASTDDYKVDLKQLACCLLARLDAPGMFTATDALPDTLDMSIEVQPFRRDEYRVRNAWKKLPRTLKVKLKPLVTGDDILVDCKCDPVDPTKVAATPPAPAAPPTPASAYSLNKDTQSLGFEYQLLKTAQGFDVASRGLKPADQKIKIDWDGPIGAGAPSVRVVFHFAYGQAHFAIPLRAAGGAAGAPNPGLPVHESNGSYTIEGSVLARFVEDYVSELNHLEHNFSPTAPIPVLKTESIEVTPALLPGIPTKAVKVANPLTMEPKP